MGEIMKNTHLRSFGIGLTVLSVAVLSFGARGILDRFATVKANEIILVDKNGDTLLDMADFVGSNQEVQASMLELQTEIKIIRNRIADNRQFEESNERRYIAIQNDIAALRGSIASLGETISSNADKDASAQQELSDAIEGLGGSSSNDGGNAALDALSDRISSVEMSVASVKASLKKHKALKKH